MATTVILPALVASESIKLGQLLTNPLNPTVDSFVSENDSLPVRAPSIQADYRDFITCNKDGRFTGRQSDSSTESCILQADQTSYTTLRDPLSAFRYISRRASSQSYLHQAALRRQQLYFVGAVQKLTNPRFTDENGQPLQLSKSQVRRQDSGVALNELDGDVVFAVELRKVFCRVGSPDEPQRPSDVGYAYKYYRLQGDDDRQLAVGFGGIVDAAEFKILTTRNSSTAHSHDAESDSDVFEFDDDEDEGCMCCQSSINHAAYRKY